MSSHPPVFSEKNMSQPHHNLILSTYEFDAFLRKYLDNKDLWLEQFIAENNLPTQNKLLYAEILDLALKHIQHKHVTTLF